MIDLLIAGLLLSNPVPPDCPQDEELGCLIVECEGNSGPYCKSNQSGTAVTNVNIIATNLPVIPAGTRVTLLRTYQARNVLNELMTFHEISWNGHKYTVNPFEITIQ